MTQHEFSIYAKTGTYIFIYYIVILPNIMYPDVQSMRPSVNFRLNRVGVTDVKKPVRIQRNGIQNVLILTIDLFVNLPASKKGADMSRNVESLYNIVNDSVKKPYDGVEYLAENIVKKLLEKHEYADFAEVSMCSDYFLEKKTPSGRTTLENYRLIGLSYGHRGKNIKKMVGVEVVGMTACPCAMETVRTMLKEKYPEHSDFLDEIPVITHNQRNNTTLILEVPDNAKVDADDLISIVESSMSVPTYEILKRKDEGHVVMEAHSNPKFVEDVVREVLTKLLDRYSDFPDDVEVIVRSESEESIHKHNAFAERATTFGELRA